MLRGKEERLDNSTDNEEHIDMECEFKRQCTIAQMKIENAYSSHAITFCKNYN